MVFVLGFALVLCLFIIYWQSEFMRNLFHDDCDKCSIDKFCSTCKPSNNMCTKAYKQFVKEHWL